MVGRIHSFQSMGAVDGPGLRYIVFMQGCPLRCIYCHNPDTWSREGGDLYTPEQVVARALRFRPYFKNGGGVTVSGGEALMQWEFVSELFGQLKAHNIHRALDTSGIGDPVGAEQVLRNTDLVICDIKFPTQEQYKSNCKGSLKKVLDFLKLTEKLGIPLWIRHVVIPGLTDSQENAGAVADLARQYRNLEKLELLPFKKLCLTKYKEMGIPFLLEGTPECTEETIEKLQEAASI